MPKKKNAKGAGAAPSQRPFSKDRGKGAMDSRPSNDDRNQSAK